ncbi:hypothetical protein BE21_02510 [Sorangium cellulosum]|uniref:Uncharacterized protein n=1 Tax=Sorangium cellulosum TaxID=56 RepID=A0A150TS29_SORCE|nr:hypothetical protein BE21_02510 [Sorangium cellulosum]
MPIFQEDGSMTTDPFKAARELQEESHRRYAAYTAGAHGRVSQLRLDELEEEWRQAHRAWWDELQRAIGTAT